MALMLGSSFKVGFGFSSHSLDRSSTILHPAAAAASANTLTLQRASRSSTFQPFKFNASGQARSAKALRHVSSELSMASSSSTTTPSKPSLTTSVLSTGVLVALDISFRRLLKAVNISFPSSLAGCGVLFTTLIALYSAKESLGDGLYSYLAPGAAVLAKWLPVFFVPSLVTLPLAQSLGSSIEVRKYIGFNICFSYGMNLIFLFMDFILLLALENCNSNRCWILLHFIYDCLFSCRHSKNHFSFGK